MVIQVKSLIIFLLLKNNKENIIIFYDTGDLTYRGLLNFGKFDDLSYHILDIPIFVVMGIVGGITGALFCHLNLKLVKFRKRYLTQ